KLLATLADFAAPVDALEAADGSLYVAELGSANLVKVSADGKTRSTVVKELRGPVALAQGPGNLVYVTEISAGAVSQIDVVTGAPPRRGRRAGRSGRHRPRARRAALCRRGGPEACGHHRSRDRHQDGDRVEPRYRPADLRRRPAGAGRDRRRGEPQRRGLCQRRHPQRPLQAHTACDTAVRKSMPGIPFIKEVKFDYGTAREATPLIRRVVANNPSPLP